MTIPEMAHTYDASYWHILFEQLIIAGVSGLLYGLRKVYTLIKSQLHKVDTVERRVNRHAEVIDMHTDIMVQAGWAKGRDLPRLVKQRRQEDYV